MSYSCVVYYTKITLFFGAQKWPFWICSREPARLIPRLCATDDTCVAILISVFAATAADRSTCVFSTLIINPRRYCNERSVDKFTSKPGDKIRHDLTRRMWNFHFNSTSNVEKTNFTRTIKTDSNVIIRNFVTPAV